MGSRWRSATGAGGSDHGRGGDRHPIPARSSVLIAPANEPSGQPPTTERVLLNNPNLMQFTGNAFPTQPTQSPSGHRGSTRQTRPAPEEKPHSIQEPPALQKGLGPSQGARHRLRRLASAATHDRCELTWTFAPGSGLLAMAPSVLY